jgi:ankyrin repeat protein/acetoin utilization deacetylase AcuC-like enzyme
MAVPSLHELCRTGDAVTLASLLDSLDDPSYSKFQTVLTAASEEGASPLHLALLNAHPSVVKVLLQAGASLVDEFEGSKPIHLSLEMCGTDAYRDRCFESLKLLINCHTDVNTQDRQGRTAAHIAAFKGSAAALSLLTTQDLDILLEDEGGKLATHRAVEGHQDESLRVLLEEFGSELLLIPDREGDLLTHLAVRRGAWTCLELLLELGSYAYLTVPNAVGATTEAVAAEHGLVAEYYSVVKGQPLQAALPSLLATHHLAEAAGFFQLDELYTLLRTDFFESRLEWVVSPPSACAADVVRVHDLSYITQLETRLACSLGTEAVPLNEFAAAVAGVVVAAVDALAAYRYKNAVCILPPSCLPSGLLPAAQVSTWEPFLFNSVAVGAAYARYRYRKVISKIALIDLTESSWLEAILSNLTPSSRVAKEVVAGSSFKLKMPYYKPWLDAHDASEVQLMKYGTDIAGNSGTLYAGVLQSLLERLRLFRPDLVIMSASFAGWRVHDVERVTQAIVKGASTSGARLSKAYAVSVIEVQDPGSICSEVSRCLSAHVYAMATAPDGKLD